LLPINNLHIEALLGLSPSLNLKTVNEDSSDKIKRLARSVGIESKYVCKSGQTFTDLAVEATNLLLKRLKLTPNDVDGLVVITQSPDYIIPGSAVLIQDRCHFPITTLAYDINLGCSGFTYGLLVGYGHLLSGMKRVFVIVGDQSYAGDSHDEGHGVLFGDSCTVTSIVLKEKDEKQLISFGSDGSGYQRLYIPHGGRRRPIDSSSFEHTIDHTGVSRCGTDVVLDGPKILSFSIETVPRELNKILNELSLAVSNIDYFVLHQANKIINDTLRIKMKGSVEQFPESLSFLGNTSSASVPMTLTSTLSGKWNQKDKKIIMCGFGIGLSWSTMLYVSDGTELSFYEISSF
jgi:3-oxoacyl-[acyl-carrier-protein] synthase-3